MKLHDLHNGLQTVARGLERAPQPAEPGELEKASCIGKEAYATAGKAHDVLRKKRPGHRYPAGRHVYRCKFCHQWHLGTDTRKGTK